MLFKLPLEERELKLPLDLTTHKLLIPNKILENRNWKVTVNWQHGDNSFAAFSQLVQF